jgi:hypothetical protein
MLNSYSRPWRRYLLCPDSLSQVYLERAERVLLFQWRWYWQGCRVCLTFQLERSTVFFHQLRDVRHFPLNLRKLLLGDWFNLLLFRISPSLKYY